MPPPSCVLQLDLCLLLCDDLEQANQRIGENKSRQSRLLSTVVSLNLAHDKQVFGGTSKKNCNWNIKEMCWKLM